MIKRLCLIFCFLLCASTAWAVEDFNSYTQSDPGDDITNTSTVISYTNVQSRLDTFYYYADKGAGYFSSNFNHTFQCEVAGSRDYFVQVWGVSNSPNVDIVGDTGNRIYLYYYNNSVEGLQFQLSEDNSTTNEAANVVANGFSAGTPYYISIDRANATVTGYIYNDSLRTDLFETLTITMTEPAVNFRYIYPLCGYDDNNADRLASGSVENLVLQVAAPPATTSTQQIIWID